MWCIIVCVCMYCIWRWIGSFMMPEIACVCMCAKTDWRGCTLLSTHEIAVAGHFFCACVCERNTLHHSTHICLRLPIQALVLQWWREKVRDNTRDKEEAVKWVKRQRRKRSSFASLALYISILLTLLVQDSIGNERSLCRITPIAMSISFLLSLSV